MGMHVKTLSVVLMKNTCTKVGMGCTYNNAKMETTAHFISSKNANRNWLFHLHLLCDVHKSLINITRYFEH